MDVLEIRISDTLYGDPGISDLTTADCHLDFAISFGGGDPKERTRTSMLIVVCVNICDVYIYIYIARLYVRVCVCA